MFVSWHPMKPRTWNLGIVKSAREPLRSINGTVPRVWRGVVPLPVPVSVPVLMPVPVVSARVVGWMVIVLVALVRVVSSVKSLPIAVTNPKLLSRDRRRGPPRRSLLAEQTKDDPKLDLT